MSKQYVYNVLLTLRLVTQHQVRDVTVFVFIYSDFIKCYNSGSRWTERRFRMCTDSGGPEVNANMLSLNISVQ